MKRLSLFLSLLMGCTATDASKQLEAYLTDQGKGLYWDIVRSTNERGQYRRSVNKHNNQFSQTLLIRPHGQVITLYNVDSVHAVPMALITPNLHSDNRYKLEHNYFVYMADTLAIDYAAQGYFLLTSRRYPKVKLVLVRSIRQHRLIGTTSPAL